MCPHRFIVTSVGPDEVVLTDLDSHRTPYIRNTGNAATHSSKPRDPYFEFGADLERAIMNEAAAELCDYRACAEDIYADEMALHELDPSQTEPPPKPTLEFLEAEPGWGG